MSLKRIIALGNGTYTHNNHFIKVVDNVVVTVTAKEDVPASKPAKPQRNKKTRIYRLQHKSQKPKSYPRNEFIDDSL